MPRLFLALLLALVALRPGEAASQDLPPNLITGGAPVPAGDQPDRRTQRRERVRVQQRDLEGVLRAAEIGRAHV